ncbi:MAG: MFS transporter [Desulfatiglandaceae bacterium]
MNPASRLHRAWIVLALCFVTLFINYSIRLGYGVIMPEMLKALNLGRAAGGTIFNAYLLIYISLTPFTGYLTDRYGARRVITICIFILAMGVGLMGTADSLLSACLFFGLTGLGATGIWTPVLTVVQRWFAPRRRGLAVGILSTGYGLGFASIGLAFPWILGHFDWRYAWFFLGAAALFMTAGNGFFLRSDPATSGLSPWGDGAHKDTTKAPVPSHTKLDHLPAIFRSARFWLIGLSYFCIAYALYGITTFMVDYAVNQLGIPMERASLLATVHGACQAIGVLTILPLSDRLGRRKTIMISNGVIAASLAAILLAAGSWALLCLSIGVMATFYGATFPLYGICAGDYFPKEFMATVIGAWTPFYGLGAVVVHWVGGFLADTTGVYTHSFVICLFMSIVAVLLMSRVRETVSRP